MTYRVTMDGKQMIQWNGNNWEVEELDWDVNKFSIKCLDPNIDEEGEDYTEWPPNEILSRWCSSVVGHKVTITDGDVGDDPYYPEWIAWADDDTEE